MTRVTIMIIAALASFSSIGCARGTTPDPPRPFTAFLTRATYDGNLAGAAGVTDGLEAADTLCTNAANGALLDGTYRAWISSSTANAIDRIDADGPWVLRGAHTLFHNRAQLSGLPLSVYAMDENGDVVEDFKDTWTATAMGGHLAVATDGFTDLGACGDWTANDSTLTVAGDPLSSDSAWTQSTPTMCAGDNHLLCLEVSDPNR